MLLHLAHEPLLVHAGDPGHGEHARLVVGAERAAQAIAGGLGRRREGAGLGHAADLPLGEGDPLDLVRAQQIEEA